MSLESLGQLVGQRDMRERRLLTHELAAVCVPEVGITNRRKVLGFRFWDGGVSGRVLRFHEGFKFTESVHKVRPLSVLHVRHLSLEIGLDDMNQGALPWGYETGWDQTGMAGTCS